MLNYKYYVMRPWFTNGRTLLFVSVSSSLDQACTFGQLALVSTGALLAPYIILLTLIDQDHTPGPLSQETYRAGGSLFYSLGITGWDPSRNNLSSACITKASRHIRLATDNRLRYGRSSISKSYVFAESREEDQARGKCNIIARTMLSQKVKVT